MNWQIDKLHTLVGSIDPNRSWVEFNTKMLNFESQTGLRIPTDLADYFRCMDNAKKELTKDLYIFYRFERFKSIDEELAYWSGIPDYSNIVNTLDRSEDCFVFAEYMAHLFSYAIRLNRERTDFNEIYLICGDKYKVVASSFSDFLEFYYSDSEDIKDI